MIPPEICEFIVEINKYRTGYGELSKIINRIQGDFERNIVEVYRKLRKDLDMTEQKLKDTKYPKFRVLSGGKEPPDEPSEDWLSTYVPGTSFVARERNSKNVDFNLYHVIFVRDEVTLLKWELPDGKLLDYYVDPKRFSNRFVDPVILGVVDLNPPEKEPGPPGTDED